MINLWRSTMMIGLATSLGACNPHEKRISLAEYEDKVYASWLGQCVGNMYGLPHEWKYIDEPRTEPITGYMPETIEQIIQAGGAFSDDDTDIEYVYLHLMEKYGPEPTYEQVAEFWMRHINRYIWVANRSARELMDQAYLPPLTGRRGINPNCYEIDPQLINEIWAVTAPGMTGYAAAKADWAARVTSDGYGTHPTVWYNTMYAAAFFERDVEKLCQIGYDHLPEDSIFRTAIDDVRAWKGEHGDDWVSVRQRIKEKYMDGQGLPEEIQRSRVSAVLNGTLGVLALLYGQGDFEKTMQYACMAGYDADNQCATLAGLLGIVHGSASIPRRFTHVESSQFSVRSFQLAPGGPELATEDSEPGTSQDEWDLPLNDFYKNRTRDALPDGRLTDMARRTALQGRELVLRHGGRVEPSLQGEVLVIDTRARFAAPLEVRLFPVHLTVGEPAVVTPEVGGDPAAVRTVALAGIVPEGMKVERRDGSSVIAGTPRRPGRHPITVTIAGPTVRRSTELDLIVKPPKQAE